MGFWIFMFIMSLLTPISITIFGVIFVKSPPKKINDLYGYRTSMSMKNSDTWLFAHNHCGKLWCISGFVMLALTVIAMSVMLWLLGAKTDTVGLYGGIVCGIQLIAIFIPLIFTEKALKMNFDKDGNRREK
jgi:uncharacterized membrane protein